MWKCRGIHSNHPTRPISKKIFPDRHHWVYITANSAAKYTQ